MKGAILEKGEKYYTCLSKVFSAINEVQENYNWLITDCVCYPSRIESKKLLQNEYCWLSGKELSEMVKKEDFQWIWAVLSGFKDEISLEDVLLYDLPYADGYTGFWQNPISMQHPLADIEIVPWDSSLTLFISKDDALVDNFKKAFPMSQCLEEYNDGDCA